MPRGRRNDVSLEGLDELVKEIGQRLGASLGVALVAGIQSGVQKAGGLESVVGGVRLARRAGAPETGGQPCRVPDCVRRAVAKGLCATHYRKARRLNMSASLTQSELGELAEDGRKTRFQKRGE